MRKSMAVLLCCILLVGSVSCAAAQSVSCPEAHLILTFPDSWPSVPLYDSGEPDLCLLLKSSDQTLSVYVSDAGGLTPGAFEVFTGDETDSGTVVFSGVEMDYVAGENADGNYRIYTWLDERNQVQLYFLITGDLTSSRKVIKRIMNSLEFE